VLHRCRIRGKRIGKTEPRISPDSGQLPNFPTSQLPTSNFQLPTSNFQLPTSNLPSKILFLDQTAQLGGAELCLRDTVLARKEAHRTDDRVVLFQHGPFEELLLAAGVDTVVHCFGSKSQSLRKESGLLRKALSSMDVFRVARIVARIAADMDVLYANTPKALVVGSIAGWLSHKPVVYHLHDILSREHFSRSSLWLIVSLANRLVSHVIANSHASLKAFKDAGGKTPATVCYNGFEAKNFDSFSENRQLHQSDLRRSRMLNAEPILGVFGRLASWKGQHIAIEALKSLPKVHLVLVGDALFGESEYKQLLLDKSKQGEVIGRVHFLGFRDDVVALMQGVDVVVHCSTAPEPFGRVIVEAMLSKRPIVASAAGGAEEIVQDNVNGCLATPGDPVHLAKRIRELLNSEDDRLRMVEAGYNSAVARFQLSKVAMDIESVIEQVVSKRAPLKLPTKV
jgi:glycosyltransferase involved in cell wall biosynthesis